MRVKGIDISHHQLTADIDWLAMSRSVEFCWIRACYGVRTDRLVAEHVASCRTHGVRLGLYTFYRQTQGAEEQLDAFMAELKRAEIRDGDLVPVVDLEWNEAYDGPVKPAKFNADARWMVEQLSSAFGQCVVYLAPGFFQTLGSPAWLHDHPWWVAHYTTKSDPWMPPGSPDWSVWQHAVKDHPAYSGGKLDQNVAKNLPIVSGPSVHQDDDVIPDLDCKHLPPVDNTIERLRFAQSELAEAIAELESRSLPRSIRVSDTQPAPGGE